MTQYKTFDALRQDIASGATTCEKITEYYLQRIQEGKQLNAFLSVYSEKALQHARRVDKSLQNGQAGALAGMVVAIKDQICIKDETVTCSSKILENFVSIYDATVIDRLQAADAILIGKTNMDEFGMGSSTENSAFLVTKNPIDLSRVPGGSSGGSAVAVAADMSTTALGEDTGGSIRQPASLCGVVGLKPTYGRVSRYGLVAYASSFDTIGPFAHSVRDCARVLSVICGHDKRDSTSADVPVPDYVAALTKDVRGMKVGVPSEFFGEGLNNEVRAAVERSIGLLKENGVTVEAISLPHTPYHIAAYYVLTTAEASSNLARYDGARYGYRAKGAKDLLETYFQSRSEGFGPEVKRRIMLGTYVLSAGYYEAYYRKAQRVRRLIKGDFDAAFNRVDCVITPTAPTTAFRIGEKINDPLQMYLSDVYVTGANLAGIPGISIPCGTDSRGLPVGLQILGKQFGEATILKLADFLESIIKSRNAGNS
ncbi:MAG: Asp-tRNA(Asn)/Glu-tRNA(Gln) amidotransferase subunit GatA [Bacteroidota bacterium]